MSADPKISRRAVAGLLAAAGLWRAGAGAQGFAGLDQSADGFAAVVPGKVFSFPADHGAHPDYRIEWWYVTANLADTAGTRYGAQWTLFRQAMRGGPQGESWASQQLWMGHAAVTDAATHRFAETFARGGVGQAGVEAKPFGAWIDAWSLRGSSATGDMTLAPLDMSASAADFAYALKLSASRALALEGDHGFSRKSQHGGQASYYYSQPFYEVAGSLAIGDKRVEVEGQAWLDREWSSQPLASEQTGWDWFALHLASGEKLMLYRLRRKDGDPYVSGNVFPRDGAARELAAGEVSMTPGPLVEVAGRKLPLSWRIAIPALSIAIDCAPLNADSWMGTSYAYWEGPIGFSGSHSGVGYLELTGY
jgi:predicted secreted hydrolase